MQTKILKVIAQGEPMYVQSKKSENGQLAKCYIRLKELGGEASWWWQPCASRHTSRTERSIRTSWRAK